MDPARFRAGGGRRRRNAVLVRCMLMERGWYEIFTSRVHGNDRYLILTLTAFAFLPSTVKTMLTAPRPAKDLGINIFT
jgi:hypothetical protein